MIEKTPNTPKTGFWSTFTDVSYGSLVIFTWLAIQSLSYQPNVYTFSAAFFPFTVGLLIIPFAFFLHLMARLFGHTDYRIKAWMVALPIVLFFGLFFTEPLIMNLAFYQDKPRLLAYIQNHAITSGRVREVAAGLPSDIDEAVIDKSATGHVSALFMHASSSALGHRFLYYDSDGKFPDQMHGYQMEKCWCIAGG